MCKTGNAKVWLVVLLFCVCSIFLTPTSAAKQPVPPAAEQDDMMDISEAVNLVDTTLDGLMDIHSILRDLRYMASRSASGSYSSTQRALANVYFQALMNEIDLVAESTEYNGFKMLDGLIESIAVRQTRNSFRIKGVDMTKAGLALDGDNLDISTLQSARLTMDFLLEAIAIAIQAEQTYIEYFISLEHLPEPNRRIDRLDDDLLTIENGIYLVGHSFMIMDIILDYVMHARFRAGTSSQEGHTPAQRTMMDAGFQEILDEIDSFAKMDYLDWGFEMLSSSTGSVTIRLNQHPQLGGIKGGPLVIQKVDLTLVGLGLDREDLNIRTIQSAEQAMEDLVEARDLLLSTWLTYNDYLSYLDPPE